jgi:hypothetical protein
VFEGVFMRVLRQFASFAATICGPLLLGACAGSLSYQGAPSIPVAAILNGLKCELSGFYAKHKDYPIRALQLDPRKTSSIDLSLKVMNGSEAGVNGKAGVLPFLGGSLVPSLSFGVENSQTIATTVSFDLEQKATKQLDCAGIKLAEKGLGLREWLEDYFLEQANVAAGEPRVGLSTVVLETNFGVSYSGGVRGDLQFHPVQLTASASASRQDIQALKITFRGAFTKRQEYSDTPPHYFRVE